MKTFIQNFAKALRTELLIGAKSAGSVLRT